MHTAVTARVVIFLSSLMLFNSCGSSASLQKHTFNSSEASLTPDSAQYHFETGAQNWVKATSGVSSVGATQTQAFAGTGSLAVNIATTASSGVQRVTTASTVKIPGATVVFHVLLPVGMPVASIQVFAQENATTSWRWNAKWQPASGLQFGQWNTLSFKMPTNASNLQTIGVEISLNAAWQGAAFIDSIGWDVAGAGADAGIQDAGIAIDAGIADAGNPGAGADAGVVQDAGIIILSDGGTSSGTASAIRFGLSAGRDGIYSPHPVDPNLRTVALWVKLRASTVPLSRQMVPWSLENNAPSTAYQMLVNTFRKDQWEAHDQRQGGFLFAPVDLGWWFVADVNNNSGQRTTLYWKKETESSLHVTSGNIHPFLSGITRFLVGTDDATGQNEWLDGYIAGVKVWNAELSLAELQQEANQLNPVRRANLHAYYPLQSVQQMYLDQSGNGRNLQPIAAGGQYAVEAGPSVNVGP